MRNLSEAVVQVHWKKTKNHTKHTEDSLESHISHFFE